MSRNFYSDIDCWPRNFSCTFRKMLAGRSLHVFLIYFAGRQILRLTLSSSYSAENSLYAVLIPWKRNKGMDYVCEATLSQPCHP